MAVHPCVPHAVSVVPAGQWPRPCPASRSGPGASSPRASRPCPRLRWCVHRARVSPVPQAACEHVRPSPCGCGGERVGACAVGDSCGVRVGAVDTSGPEARRPCPRPARMVPWVSFYPLYPPCLMLCTACARHRPPSCVATAAYHPHPHPPHPAAPLLPRIGMRVRPLLTPPSSTPPPMRPLRRAVGRPLA